MEKRLDCRDTTTVELMVHITQMKLLVNILDNVIDCIDIIINIISQLEGVKTIEEVMLTIVKCAVSIHYQRVGIMKILKMY